MRTREHWPTPVARRNFEAACKTYILICLEMHPSKLTYRNINRFRGIKLASGTLEDS